MLDMFESIALQLPPEPCSCMVSARLKYHLIPLASIVVYMLLARSFVKKTPLAPLNR
jgi:hypothetical protein